MQSIKRLFSRLHPIKPNRGVQILDFTGRWCLSLKSEIQISPCNASATGFKLRRYPSNANG